MKPYIYYTDYTGSTYNTENGADIYRTRNPRDLDPYYILSLQSAFDEGWITVYDQYTINRFFNPQTCGGYTFFRPYQLECNRNTYGNKVHINPKPPVLIVVDQELATIYDEYTRSEFARLNRENRPTYEIRSVL